MFRPRNAVRRPQWTKGWSLVELTILLVVLAVLTAVLAPVIGRFVQNAKMVRCREDLQAIGSAIVMYVEDTANSYFLMDGSPCLLQGASRADSATGWGSAPDQSAANRVEMLVSDGDVPELGTNGSISWTRGVDFGKVDFFEYHLVTNRPGNNPDNCYRTPLNLDKGAGAYDDDPMFARRSSGGFNSEFAWRGPYLTAPIDPDPWGNRYAANVIFLDPRADSRNNRPDRNGFTQDCVVISAGPDEEIDTAYARDGLTPGDDDIIYTVSGNSR